MGHRGHTSQLESNIHKIIIKKKGKARQGRSKSDKSSFTTLLVLGGSSRRTARRVRGRVRVALLLLVRGAMRAQALASKILRGPALAIHVKRPPVKGAPRRPENPPRPMGARRVSG